MSKPPQPPEQTAASCAGSLVTDPVWARPSPPTSPRHRHQKPSTPRSLHVDNIELRLLQKDQQKRLDELERRAETSSSELQRLGLGLTVPQWVVSAMESKVSAVEESLQTEQRHFERERARLNAEVQHLREARAQAERERDELAAKAEAERQAKLSDERELLTQLSVCQDQLSHWLVEATVGHEERDAARQAVSRLRRTLGDARERARQLTVQLRQEEVRRQHSEAEVVAIQQMRQQTDQPAAPPTLPPHARVAPSGAALAPGSADTPAANASVRPQDGDVSPQGADDGREGSSHPHGGILSEDELDTWTERLRLASVPEGGGTEAKAEAEARVSAIVAELAWQVNSGLLLSPQLLGQLVDRLSSGWPTEAEAAQAEAAEEEAAETEARGQARVEPAAADGQAHEGSGEDEALLAELARQLSSGLLLSPQQLERFSRGMGSTA